MYQEVFYLQWGLGCILPKRLAALPKSDFSSICQQLGPDLPLNSRDDLLHSIPMQIQHRSNTAKDEKAQLGLQED